MRIAKGWMLGAAVLAGALGVGAVPAQAAEFGAYQRGPAAYVPPCPGPGYVWMAGYYADGYWMPGRWEFRGERDRAYFGRFEGERERGRNFSERGDRGRGEDRGRGRDGDRFRR